MFSIKRKTERGQAIVMIAIAIVGLVSMTALAVDGGNAFSDKQNAQNAADTAALAAALKKTREGNASQINDMALDMAKNNGYDNDDSDTTVEVHNPPVSGPYAGNDEYIQVIQYLRQNNV